MKRFSLTSLYLIAATLFFGSIRMLSGQEVPNAPEDPETKPDEVVQVTLQSVPFQEVLNRLFGAPGTDGLLSGEHSMVLHAEDVSLTLEEAKSFFAPSTPTETDFASLVAAFHDSKRGNVSIDGTVDGTPFELMIAGRQLKVEGISLTQAELDSLLDSLQDTPGLHQAKIDATADGKPVSIHLQNSAGRLRILDQSEKAPQEGQEKTEAANADRGRPRGESEAVRRDERSDVHGRPEHAERADRIESSARSQRPERPEKVERPDKPERPELAERPERVERIEHFERPEFARGRGRH